MLPNDGQINGVGVQPDIYIENYSNLNLDHLGDLVPLIEDKTYQVGEVGLNVYGVEQRLEALDYELRVDGVFDKLTQTALINFQIEHGLNGTGILDNESIDVINSYFALSDLDPNIDYQMLKSIRILNDKLRCLSKFLIYVVLIH